MTVVELTPESVGALDRAGLRHALPFAFLRPREGGGGAGIYARSPLTDGQLLRGFELSNLHARLTLPNRSPISVYALHPLPPYPEPSWRWNAELRELRSILSADTDPLIIGADANSGKMASGTTWLAVLSVVPATRSTVFSPTCGGPPTEHGS